jgi:hypothetical protein
MQAAILGAATLSPIWQGDEGTTIWSLGSEACKEWNTANNHPSPERAHHQLSLQMRTEPDYREKNRVEPLSDP